MPPELLPALIRRVVGAGPKLAAHVRPADPAFDLAQAFDTGRIDLVINNDPRPREDLRIGMLFTDEVVCLMRRDHPLAQDRRLSLARYLRMRHLSPHTGAAPHSGPIDGELAKTGYRRQIAATVPEFGLAPYALLDSDLVFTTARGFAEHFAARLPLAVVPAPAEIRRCASTSSGTSATTTARPAAGCASRWPRRRVSSGRWPRAQPPRHNSSVMGFMASQALLP